MRRGVLSAVSVSVVAMVAVLFGSGARGDVIEVGAGGGVAVRASDRGGAVEVGAVEVGVDGAGGVEAGADVPAGALTTLAEPAVPLALRAAVARAAAAARVSPSLLAALVWQESRWRAGALSPRGARGLTQLMPGTARALGVDPADPLANLAGGARYLRAQLDRFDGNVEHALAAYNAGPGRVVRAGGLPAIAETRAYVAAIIARLGAAGTIDGGRTP